MKRNTIEKSPVRVVRIKELMKEENLSQHQLAEKLHMTQQNLSRILKSEKISDVLINDICELFPEYSPDWLRGEDVKIINRIRNKLNLMGMKQTGFGQLALSLGFSIADTDDQSKICIQKDNQTALLSHRAYDALQKDICDYMEFKISKLF